MQTDMKMPFAVVLCALTAAMAWSENQTGSVKIFRFSRAKITIAADSRVTHSDGTRDDKECKLAALGNRFVFSATGLTGQRFQAISPAWPTGWNAWDEARAAWEAQLAETGGVIQSGFVRKVADRWGERVASMFRLQSPAEFPQIVHHEMLTMGLFAGVNFRGVIVVVVEIVKYDKQRLETSGILSVSNEGFPLDPGNGYCDSIFALGKTEIATELACGTSDRAKHFAETWNRESVKIRADKRDSEYLERLVKATARFHPDRDSVGGPVDVIEVDANNGTHWVQRKENCPPD